MERPDLAEDPRFATLADRAARRRRDQRHRRRRGRRSLTADEIEARCVAHDVPVGTAYSAADIFADPHMAARGDLVTVDDPVIGAGPPAGAVPPADEATPAPCPRGAPRLGEHNEEVWCDLVGLSDAELEDLTARGVL